MRITVKGTNLISNSYCFCWLSQAALGVLEVLSAVRLMCTMETTEEDYWSHLWVTGGTILVFVLVCWRAFRDDSKNDVGKRERTTQLAWERKTTKIFQNMLFQTSKCQS